MLALALCAVVSAAEVPTVELSASPTTVQVGATVAVTITYRWPRGWSVADEPDPGPLLAPLFVTSAPPPERLSTGDGELRTFRYTIAAARSGAWLLPRPAFSARGPVGETRAEAPEVVVQVGTEAAPPNLPAARPLLTRPPPGADPGLPWAWLAVGLAAVVAVVIWLLRARRRAERQLSAWEIAERELAEARQAGEAREVGTRLSLAVRRYAGAVWNFDGPGQTTREVAASLRRRTADAAESAALLRLLGRLDDLRWCPGDVPAAAMAELSTEADGWARGVQRRLDAEAVERAARKGRR